MKYIYVAGPYSTGDPVVNTRRAIDVGEQLSHWGWTPYIPHLSLFWHVIYPHEVQFWYDYDLAWLMLCDVLVRLQGDSSGADREVERAKELGLVVYQWPLDMPVLKSGPPRIPDIDDIPDGPDD